MADFALVFDPALGEYDLAIGPDGDFVMDDGLNPGVTVSLNTDRQALPDDRLPDADAPGGGSGDRRGFWGDWYLIPPADPSVDPAPGSRPVPQFRWGSRRWLLERSKNTADIPVRLVQYDTEALDWIPANGIGIVTVEAFYLPQRPNRIYERITIARPAQPNAVYSYVWDAMAWHPAPVPSNVPPAEILDPLGNPILDPASILPVLEP